MIDNYCRNVFFEKIKESFNNICLYCGSKSDLTLDHFGIPKNSGGNFILMSKTKKHLKLNVILLCRSCNSMKGEMNYFDFLGKEKLKLVSVCHERLLSFIYNDQGILAITNKWYSQD